jgi:hypothetical protein
MTAEQFNEKYKDYLENGHYGLGIDIHELTEWLDSKFQEFIKQPEFRYSQIKVKFGMGRFYCEGLSSDEIYSVEDKITQICKKK